MPDGAGGNKEPSPLERLVAARQAEKKAQRKKDSVVITLLVIAVLVIAGGGVATWLRLAPPSWLHHKAAATTAASARPTARATLTTRPLSPVATNGPPAGEPVLLRHPVPGSRLRGHDRYLRACQDRPR
jgi:hypothetical protein